MRNKVVTRPYNSIKSNEVYEGAIGLVMFMGQSNFKLVEIFHNVKCLLFVYIRNIKV
jgi:hypothetical protein